MHGRQLRVGFSETDKGGDDGKPAGRPGNPPGATGSAPGKLKQTNFIFQVIFLINNKA
jgi:hypothetical protein